MNYDLLCLSQNNHQKLDDWLPMMTNQLNSKTTLLFHHPKEIYRSLKIIMINSLVKT